MLTCAIIDFETTGLGPPADRVIEVGVARLQDGVVVDTFSQLMQPGFTLPWFITALTGINDAMLARQPRPEAVMPRLRAFLGDLPCVAHNAAFDRRFFANEMDAAGEAHARPFLCSLLLARRLLPQERSHRLGALAARLGVELPAGERAHRALGDALLAAGVWRHLMLDLRQRLGRPADAALLAALARVPKAQVPAWLARHAVG